MFNIKRDFEYTVGYSGHVQCNGGYHTVSHSGHVQCNGGDMVLTMGDIILSVTWGNNMRKLF